MTTQPNPKPQPTPAWDENRIVDAIQAQSTDQPRIDVYHQVEWVRDDVAIGLAMEVHEDMRAELDALHAQLDAAAVPDWSTAPDWATYWTRDVSGVTMWWETKPFYDGRIGAWMCEDESRRVRGTDLAVLHQRRTAEREQAAPKGGLN